MSWFTVRNFRDQIQRHSIRLRLSPNITATPSILEGTVPAKSRQQFKVELKATSAPTATGLQMIPFDITLDDKHHGELFDFLVYSKPAPTEASKGK